jgi:hypothetical protein
MTLKSAATGDSSFGHVIKDLLEAFPQPINLDYFAYSGVAQTDVLMDEDQISRFERFASFTSMLHSSGIIDADKFYDGSTCYFWNVRLTVTAYDAFRRQFPDKTLNDSADIMSIIAAIHRSTPKTLEPEANHRSTPKTLGTPV